MSGLADDYFAWFDREILGVKRSAFDQPEEDHDDDAA